jgi:putative salt-induced outer membrane protein YdiY
MQKEWVMSSHLGKLSTKAILAIVFLLVLAASAAHADVVTLKNGDRVTGTLVSVKGGTLELKSDALGDLMIPLAKVATFTSEKPVAVVVKGRAAVVGQLELGASGNWQVTENGKSQTIPETAPEVVMPADAYQALMEHNAPVWKDWKGAVSLGYSVQRGDQNTSSFATTVGAVRERPAAPMFERHWRTNFTLTTLLSHDTQAGTSITSNTLTTGIRQDYLFTVSNFAFGLAEIDHVGAQGLYLRQTYGGGMGHDFLKTPRATFSMLGGITFVHEKFFTGVYDQNAAAFLGERFGYQFSKSVRLDHSLNVYPNLSATGEYRFDTTTTLSAKLSNRFSLTTGVVDLYLSNPAVGSQKNNIAFTTGLGYTF